MSDSTKITLKNTTKYLSTKVLIAGLSFLVKCWTFSKLLCCSLTLGENSTNMNLTLEKHFMKLIDYKKDKLYLYKKNSKNIFLCFEYHNETIL